MATTQHEPRGRPPWMKWLNHATDDERARRTRSLVRRHGLITSEPAPGQTVHAGPCGLAALDLRTGLWLAWRTYAGAMFADGIALPHEADAIRFVMTGETTPAGGCHGDGE